MKELGKISSAEFGTIDDYPNMIGLQLHFALGGGTSAIGDGGIHTVNISKSMWEGKAKSHRNAYAFLALSAVLNVLTEAKVYHVSQLKNKPVEVVIEGNVFKSFRILKEVL